MASTLQARIAGIIDDVKGRAKVAVGELTNNDNLKTAGREDRGSGAVKQSVADAKDTMDDVVTKVNET